MSNSNKSGDGSNALASSNSTSQHQTENRKPSSREQVEAVLISALELKATDIYFVPGTRQASLSFRIVGILVPQPAVSEEMMEEYLRVLAQLARLDYNNLIQSGRGSGYFTLDHHDSLVEFQVAFVRDSSGLTACVRPMLREEFTLEDLGFEPEQLEAFKEIENPGGGLVIVAGPTGSGKSATASSILRRFEKSDSLKIVEICDPIRQLEDMRTQIQLDDTLSWNEALNAVLHFDADVIHVGDVRTTKQVKTVVEKSFTGPLLICTFHATSIAAVINHLTRMKIDPYELSAVLRLIIAQRLERRLCENCKVQVEQTTYYLPRGCARCAGTGYSGHTMIAEVLPITKKVGDGLERGASGTRIMQHAVEKDGVLTIEAVEERKAKRGLIVQPAMKERMRDFKEGRIEVLTDCNLLTEGFDVMNKE